MLSFKLCDSISELSTVGNAAWYLGSSGLTSDRFEGIEDVESVNNLSEDGVLSIEPVACDESKEELGSVGVGSSVGH